MKKLKRQLIKRKQARAKKLSRQKNVGFTTGSAELDLVFNKAIALHQAGQMAEAEELYRQILQECPDSAVVLCNMGLAVWSQGRPDEAEKAFRRSLAIAPGVTQVHNNLGLALKDQGRLVEAETSFKDALRADPVNAEAHNNLGLVLKEFGRLEDSGRAFQAAIKIRPDYFEALSNLGSIRLEQENLAEAAKLFKKAITIKPDYVEALYNLGICYRELGRYGESEENYRQAIRLRPTYAAAHNNLGILLANQGEFPEAEDCYRKALEIDPGHFRALINLGEIFEKTNRLAEAEDAVRGALKIDPEAGSATRLLATLLRREGKHQEALAQLAGVNIQDCGLEKAVEIHHELGMIHERLDNRDKAFYHFSEAQKMQMLTGEGKRADKNRYLADLDRLAACFSKKAVEQWQGEDHDQPVEQPIFIVGFPRSGTTLIDQLLNSHPAFSVAEETAALDRVIARLAARKGGYPAALSDLSGAELQSLREGYLSDLDKFIGQADRGAGTRIVDKYPLHITHLGLIYRLFPKARVIVAIRHPYDVCLSNFMQLFKPNDAMANFNTLEDAACCYEKVMGLWLQYEKVLPLNFHKIRYEDLIANFDQEVRSLLGFLDVEWDERVAKYYEHARGRAKIYTPSYQQVTEPIYQRAVYRWQKYESHFAGVGDILAPYIREFGYDEV